MDGTAQHAGVAEVELKAFCFEQLPGLAGFFAPLFGKVDIGPTGKTVFKIPLAFAMSHENKLKHDEFLYER